MKNPVARNIIDHFEELNDCTSIDVDSLVNLVPRIDNARQYIIKFLKELEAKKWGRFFTGRRGHKSRFEAPLGLGRVSKLLTPTARTNRESGSPSEKPMPQNADVFNEDSVTEPTPEESGCRTLTHCFPIRPDYLLTIVLPMDLAGAEASRLADFIKSLPFHRD